MLNFYVKARTWMDRDEGATAVEYGIMVALIAVAIIVVVGVLGDNLADLFGFVGDEVQDAMPAAPGDG